MHWEEYQRINKIYTSPHLLLQENYCLKSAPLFPYLIDCGGFQEREDLLGYLNDLDRGEGEDPP